MHAEEGGHDTGVTSGTLNPRAMGTRGTPPLLTPMTDGIDADAWGQPTRLLLVSYISTIN